MTKHTRMKDPKSKLTYNRTLWTKAMTLHTSQNIWATKKVRNLLKHFECNLTNCVYRKWS